MIPRGARALSARVLVHRGRPALFVNGEQVQPVFYALTDYPGGRWTWEEMPRHSLSLFAGLGFRLFQVDLMLEQLWTGPGVFSIEPARRQVAGVLDAAPGAGVVIRLHTNAPPWWIRSHPDECVGYADGPVDAPLHEGMQRPLDRDLERAPRQSLASETWRREAGGRVRELCRLLARTREGGAVIGFHVANGVFGEWAYFGFIKHEPDTGPAMTAAFRSWLSRRYGDDAALRAAWRDPAASAACAEVPGVGERAATRAGIFRDPREERRVIDYFSCQHEVLAETMLGFCRIVKESWPRPILTGVFYGYLFSQFGRQAAGGHLELGRVLSSPDVDYLSGPQTYQPYTREIGGTGQSRGLLESCALHGKLWLDEMDQPTHLGTVADRSFSCTLPDAVALLRRNVLHPLLRGHGLWYYDFGPRFSSGWWDDPALLAEIRRMKELIDRRLDADYESPADVLLVCDTAVFYHTAHTPEADPVSERALDECSAAIYRSGVSFHMVHLADLELVDWTRYRAVVFANTWLLTARQRSFIRGTVAAGGRHVVWSYAPGYSDGESLDPARISEVTGIRVERIRRLELPRIRIPDSRGGADLVEAGPSVDPLFSPRDERAEVLGWFEEGDVAAIARADRGASTGWFSSLPITSPQLLRRIFRESGAHVYSDADDVLIAGWGLLCLHCEVGGPRAICLRGGATLTLDLPSRSTCVLDASDGHLVLG